jgi:hypothetical protein
MAVSTVDTISSLVFPEGGLMKRESLMRLLVVVFLGLFSSNVMAQETATLYSPFKYPTLNRVSCLNFRSGLSSRLSDPCDLRYGIIRFNSDWDWFQSSTTQGNRSVIKDLGALSWSDKVRVPVVAALPKLKPGERREIRVPASAAARARGTNTAATATTGRVASGPAGDPGPNGFIAVGDPQNGRFIAATQPLPVVVPATPPAPPRQPKNDKRKTDSLAVQAVVGHMYVIYVVDDVNDFYALFRVESVDRGNSCTVSWRLTPTPTKH